MKVMLAARRRKGIVPRVSQDWPAGFLRQCDNCGLEWEALQEHENCPLADLEAVLFPCFIEGLPKHPDSGTYPDFLN